MTPAFGFSAGDIVNAIGLIKKVRKALKDTGGASSEYQHVVIELQGLENVLRQLEALEPNEHNVNHINAIRGMALACQIPLQHFLTKIERYNTSMSPFATRFTFRSAADKAQWALSITEDVTKLRALVAAKVLNVNLLLAMHVSDSVSRIEARLKADDVRGKLTEHRSQLDRVESRVHTMDKRLDQERTETNTRLNNIETTVQESRLAMFSLRALSDQVSSFLGSFPREVRHFMQRMLQDNYNIYRVLLQIHNNIAARPTITQNSDIKFEDALGRTRNLPWDFFRFWEPFEGLLKAEFKGLPGEDKVVTGQYHLIDSKRQSAIVKQDAWTRLVLPGTTLAMSMLLSQLRRADQCCPRPKCESRSFTKACAGVYSICDECGITFFDVLPDSADTLGQLAVQEKEDVLAAKQADEDTKLYGVRPTPPESFEVDGLKDPLIRRGQKWSLSALEGNKLQPVAEWRKPSATTTMNCHPVTDETGVTYSSIDWNSGATPLDAWLNQSAVPSDHGNIDGALSSGKHSDHVRYADEANDVEVFRRVHIASNTDTEIPARTPIEVEADGLELGAQIYFRNIMDRYPSLPFYLARRLAEANHKRANWLQEQRRWSRIIREMVESWEEASEQPLSRAACKERNGNITASHGLQQQQVEKEHETSDSIDFWKHVHEMDTEIDDHGQRHDSSQSHMLMQRLDEAIQSYSVPFTDAPVKSSKTLSPPTHTEPSHEASFWTAARKSRRASSICSGSSSRNSSLRDVPLDISDLSEQAPIFPTKRSECSSHEAYPVRPCLPPPPKEIKDGSRTECDICGFLIVLSRKLDWQQHVMSDIKPYVGTHPDATTFMYDTRRSFMLQEVEAYMCSISHRQFSYLLARDRNLIGLPGECMFCMKSTGKTVRDYGRHVGRHMEEIAFTVIPKQYEDWEFYSETSSIILDAGKYAFPDAYANSSSGLSSSRSSDAPSCSSSAIPKQKQKRIDVVEETHPIEAAWETIINPQVHKILEQSPKLDEAWTSIGVRETDESSMALSVRILGAWDPQFADLIEAKRQIRRVLDEEGFTDVGIWFERGA